MGIFESIGAGLIDAFNAFVQTLVMAADIFYWSFVGLFQHSGQRKGSFTQQGIALGIQAVPVVGLLSLIIGFILSLQSAAQLRNFGANVFIADLLSISLVREMGPMMTAIIVAGRSGSAIASEIASMQVSEEIDALRMMAINPIRYVVVPKVSCHYDCNADSGNFFHPDWYDWWSDDCGRISGFECPDLCHQVD